MNAPARKDPPAARVGVQGTRAPLRECVREALDAYLDSLGDHDAKDLYRLVMHEVEAPMLEAVLAHTRGNQSRAAQMLGINRGTLRKKLRLYGLE
jgi:Fis family transcriptional regulator